MPKTPRAFRATLLIGWIVLGAAGVAYARFKRIPNEAAFPALAAFLVEYPFYLVPAFPDIRALFRGRRLPVYLVGSAVLPYLVCCFGTVDFHWGSLVRVVALALAFALWYVVLPVNPVVDLAFLALIPVVLLGGYLKPVYAPKYSGFKDIIFLGHITLIQLAVMVLLVERRIAARDYGFVPNFREWRIGVIHFFLFLLVGGPVAIVFGMKFGNPAPWWKIVASFIGFLWTIALSEEFFFWGVLQQWIRDWTSRSALALLLTAVLFGLVHIGFGGLFPNWRWVLLAAILGWFCGRARNQAGSIRASMVTHALVFATWRGFFV
jgi:membrane protease YdiL (CAAX protease family)